MERITISKRWLVGLVKAAKMVEKNPTDKRLVLFLVGYVMSLVSHLGEKLKTK